MRQMPGFEHAERAAFATSEPSSQGEDYASVVHARWTELSVYYDRQPEDPGKPWIAVARGLSTYPGERTREEIIRTGTLARALKLFDEGTQLGRSVITQAQDWEDGHNVRMVELEEHALQRRDAEPKVPGFRGDNQLSALAWLYGDELEKAKPASLLKRDFGVGESTARMQLKAGRPIMIPFTEAMRFFDREAFRAAMEEAARG